MKTITITGTIKSGRRVEMPIGNMPIYRFEILCSKSGYKFPIGVHSEEMIDKISASINKCEKTIEVELASFFKSGQHIIVMNFMRFKGSFDSYMAAAMYGEESSQIS